jgi:hypothetical protein
MRVSSVLRQINGAPESSKIAESFENRTDLESQEQSQWQPFDFVPVNTIQHVSLQLKDVPSSPRLSLAESTPLIERMTPNPKVLSANPWASVRKTSGTKKSKKSKMRVSFGVAADPLLPDSPQTLGAGIMITSRTSSSPEIDYNEDQGAYIAKRTISLPAGTRDCFTAKKPFKRILPNKSASQINSSPAPIDAMAEAFVAADDGKAADDERPKTPRSQLRSPILPYETTESLHDAIITPMGNIAEEQENVDFDFGMPGFNIDEALGEASDFLEDWSVEAELKKAREGEKVHETNPVRRSRYFGIA